MLNRWNFLKTGFYEGINIGNQNYPLPTGTDPADFNAVVIYCNPFNVIFAVAPLEADSAL